MRYRLAYDSGLARDVLQIFIQTVFSSLRRRAKKQFGIRKARCGGVTFVQRFGGAINLNIHFHSLVFDGVYYEDSDGQIRFRRLLRPTDAEVASVTAGIVKKVQRLLERRGLGPQADFEEADPLLRDQPLLAELYSASVQGRIAVGPGAGERLKGIRFEFEMEGEGKRAGPLLRQPVGIQSACQRMHSREGTASVGESMQVCGAAGGGDGTFVAVSGRTDFVSAEASLAGRDLVCDIRPAGSAWEAGRPGSAAEV